MSGWCCAQSAVSLGDEDERQRLLASANAILPSVPRSGAPDRPGRQRQGAEAALIAGGRAERVGVIHTAVAAETHSRAGALLSTGGPLHPLEAPHADPQQLTYHRLQLLVGLLLLAISLGGLVLLLALFT
jgi:hypothetical protein